MCHIFARRLDESSGVLSRAALWLQTILELTGNAAAVHGDILRHDLRYTRRTLARTPGFTVTAILIVALGVGATTAAFSVTDFVLFRPLPFHEPDRLVTFWETKPGFDGMELSPANYRDWKSASHSFESIGAYHGLTVNMVGKASRRGSKAPPCPPISFRRLAFGPSLDGPSRPPTTVAARRGRSSSVIASGRMTSRATGASSGSSSISTTPRTRSSASCRPTSSSRPATPRSGRR